MKQKLSLFLTLLSALGTAPLAQAIDLSAIKEQGKIVSENFSRVYQTNLITKNFAINDISHQYLLGYGQVFTIETNIDFLPILNNIPSHQNEHLATEEPQTEAHKQQLNNKKELEALQLEERNLAHHEFSLDKKIKSMQKRSKASNQEAELQKLDKSIRQSQTELDELRDKKQLIAVRIKNKKMANTMQQSKEKPIQGLSRKAIYQTMLKRTYELVCTEKLLSALPESEQLTVIFKDLGEEQNDDFKDEVWAINMGDASQCQRKELSIKQLDAKAKKYQY
ncbi:hypothetical protein [Litorilituus lipolyticus]|uniref:Uncharacterized protein n=1 Tax=Litorilituus lipolyticus TaxID=2491017 RepID=A0A502KR18_9GAMM|nr:hypothetical protein [Litorilituus lipolyticus]TPH13956.1 hypothetical protein EPA86_12635 [Litorilituus lipolyticus]